MKEMGISDEEAEEMQRAIYETAASGDDKYDKPIADLPEKERAMWEKIQALLIVHLRSIGKLIE
jgi:hypothetical protein